MLDAILGFFLLGVLLWVLYGMFSPNTALFWQESSSRWGVLGYGLSIFLGITILGGIVESWSEQAEFEENRAKILSRIEASIEEGNLTAAIDSAEKHLEYVDDGKLDSLYEVAKTQREEAKIQRLKAELRATPQSLLETRRDLFRDLDSLRPSEPYSDSVQKYAEEIKRQKAIEGKEIDASTYCERHVRRRLKSPSTADFPWGTSDRVQYSGDGRYRMRSYVDAENAFGATVRLDFDCIVKTEDGESWRLIDLQMQQR
jgi:hypothetical protein